MITATRRTRRRRRIPLRVLGALALAMLFPAATRAGIVDSMWTRVYSGLGAQKMNEAYKVVLDSARSAVYVVGRGEGAGGAGLTHMLIVKYDLEGRLKWSRGIGLSYPDDDYGYTAAVDASGNVYVAGVVGYPDLRMQNMVITKFGPNGDTLWIYNTERSYPDFVTDMVIAPTGDLYAVGTMDSLTGNGHYTAYTVMRMDPTSGTVMWRKSYILDTLAFDSNRGHRHKPKRFVSPDFVEWDYSDWDNCATAIALSPDGDIVVTGFGRTQVGAHDGDLDWWTMKFGTDGTRRWQAQFSYPGTVDHDDDAAFDVAVGADGAIYCVGTVYYEDASDYSWDYGIVKYRGSDGTRLGYKRFDGPDRDDDAAFGVCLDDSTPQNVYVTGYLGYPAPLYDDIFTVKLGSTVINDATPPKWQGAFGGTGDDHGYEIYYKSGRVYVTGVYGSSPSDVAALAYTCTNPSGGINKDTLWTYRYHCPNTGDNVGASIFVGDTNKVFVAGSCGYTSVPPWSSIYLSRLVIAHPDVAVKSIVVPRDTVDSGTVQTPLVMVKNQGNLLPTFKTYLRIGASYLDSATADTLKPGDTVRLQFKNWAAAPMGKVFVRCSVAVSPDTNPANNVLRDSVFVAKLDAACMRIVAPTGSIDSGVGVVPQAWLRNLGNVRQTFNVRFAVGSVYADTEQATINAGDSTMQGFKSWTPTHRGDFATRCSTMLAGDLTDTNNQRVGTVTVRVRDVVCAAILAPGDTVDSGSSITPQVRLQNAGSEQQSFRAFFRAESGTDSTGYLDSVAVVLAAGRDTAVTFAASPPLLRLGQWQIVAYHNLPDQHPENDTLKRGFFVKPKFGIWPPGWVEVAPIPTGLSGKSVKAGGSVVAVPSTATVYATKGYKTAEFYSYDVRTDAWTVRTPVPPGLEGKLPYTGCDLASDGNNTIYMTKGNNSVGFWKYTIADSAWTQLENVPLGIYNKKVKAGTGLAYVIRNDSGFVYMLKGYKNEFFRYNVSKGSWETMRLAPVGINIKYDKGSFIVYDGSNYIYAHKAKYNELWRYDISRDTWTGPLTGMPLINNAGQRKKSKDGGSGTWYNGYIFALKGGNTTEFWRYDAAKDSWLQIDTMPSVGSTGRKKRVKDGADIFYFAHACWALKGNKTREFWRYGIPLTEYAPNPDREGVQAEQVANGDGRMAIYPNPLTGNGYLRYSLSQPALVTLKAYTADGRLAAVLLDGRSVSGSGSVSLNTGRLAAGIYVLRLDTGPTSPARSFKLVVR